MNKSFKNFREKFGKVTTSAIAITAMLSTMGVSAATITKTTDNLNLREGQSTRTKVIQVIKKGQEVNVLSKSGSWSKVEYGGKTGYVYNKYLTEVSTGEETPKVKSTGTVQAGSSRLNVRSKASTSGSILGKLYTGAKVQITGESGSWYKIIYNGQIGYVYKQYVKADSIETPEIPDTPETPEVKSTGTVQVGSSRLNVRSKASTSGVILGKLYTGAKVQITGESGSWYKIIYNGKTGYVYKQYVKVDSTETPETPEKIGKEPIITVKQKVTVKVGQKLDTSKFNLSIIDKEDGNITDKAVIDTSKVDTDKLGDYNVTITVKDSDGNEVSKTVKVSVVVDVTEEKDSKPVIKVEPRVFVKQGQKLYKSQLKLKVIDKEDGDITDKAIIDTSAVDTSKLGEQKLNITVKDSAGNKVSKDVLVYVIENEVTKDKAPVIQSVDELTIVKGQKVDKNNLKLKVTDEKDGDLTNKAVIDDSKLCNSKPGIYYVVITVKDSAGNQVTKTVKVTVKDEAPVIKVEPRVFVKQGEKLYKSQLKLKVIDKEDGDITHKAIIDTSAVDTSKLGEQKLNITVKDSAGNKVSKDVLVYVIENEATKDKAPVIQSVDELSIYVGESVNKSQLKLKVTDEKDGDLTSKAVIDRSQVDTSKAGEYKLTITVKDSAGNQVTKTVSIHVLEDK
ncbi:SH3 domain-containing protein [Intestinibacter sp.]